MAQLKSSTITGSLAVTGDTVISGDLKVEGEMPVASSDGKKAGVVYIKYGEDGTLYISNAPIS